MKTWTNMKHLRNCKPSVYGWSVWEEGRGWGWGVRQGCSHRGFECSVEKRSQLHVHANCAATQGHTLQGAPDLVSCSAVTILKFKIFEQRPCISFTTGPYKLWPYPCWSVETICISRKKNFFKQSNLSLVLKRCQSVYTNANNSQKKKEKFLKKMLLTKLLTKEISSVTVILALFCWFLLTLYKILNIPWDHLYKMNTLNSTGKIIWHSLCQNIQCFILSLKLDLLST